MGIFSNISKMFNQKESSEIPETPESHETSETSGTPQVLENINLAPTSHMVQDEIYGDDDSKYLMSFKVNDAFKEAKSHAAEVEMLNVYAPTDEHGEEGTFPYLAIQIDDEIYNAVEEFKESGTFTKAMELTKLSGKFYFKAKMEYYEHIMYFYGLDRCDGFWENNGICMVYPKEYVGTEDEKKLMKVLDEAAESYSEERIEE